MVLSIKSFDALKNQLYHEINKSKLIVVDFYATWCAPCSRIAPKVDEWSENQFKDTVLFLKVDIDEAEALTQKFDVEAMPTFLFFKDGKEIHRFIGVNYVQLEKDIQDRI